jgi:hypothetical protein
MTVAPILPLSHGFAAAEARRHLRAWGITYAMIADELSVSRQYIWQIVHRTVPVSPRMQAFVQETIAGLILEQQRSLTPGKRMRAARVISGLTLKQAAALAGYTWVAVQRWEKDICVPKPGVLWHLRMIYGVGEDWTPGSLDTRRSA